MMLNLLSDSQFKRLQSRLQKIGKDKLIDRLENEAINFNLQGKSINAKRAEQSLVWTRKQSDWGN